MMKKFYYDFHIHSCLSPCGDNESTPNNIAGMASLCELDIVALTDHNTCKNCPAFFCAAEKYGIIPIAGMELTTSEDIHVVCLFETLDDAMRFDSHIQTLRYLIKNRPNFFGEQLILDGEDNVIGSEEYLLTNATSISIEDVYSHVSKFGGVCYPAHIDRSSNGLIAILGTVPQNSDFTFYELRDADNIDSYCEQYSLNKSNIIVSSDAHNLESIRDKENYFLLTSPPSDAAAVRSELFSILRRNI